MKNRKYLPDLVLNLLLIASVPGALLLLCTNGWIAAKIYAVFFTALVIVYSAKVRLIWNIPGIVLDLTGFISSFMHLHDKSNDDMIYIITHLPLIGFSEHSGNSDTLDGAVILLCLLSVGIIAARFLILPKRT